MADRNIQLKDKNGNKIYPRVTLSNIVAVPGATATVTVPTLDANNLVSAANLPAATTSSKGAVIINQAASNGVSLSVSNGTVSVSTVSGTTAAQGTVRLATVAEAGSSTLETVAVTPKGLQTELGKVSVTLSSSTGITITSGSTVGLAAATSSAIGGVVVGTNISVSNGTISVASASTGSAGVIQMNADIANATGAALNHAPTVDAVKTYVSSSIAAGLTCEII